MIHASARPLTFTALFAAAIAVSAYLRVPIGPVPLTAQSPVVLITGYCLGTRYGAAATILYTAIGLAGLPVFAMGGGPGYLLSPTFGYIIGFTASAAVTGALVRLNTRGSVPAAYLIMLAGLIALYIPGVLWLTVAMSWIAATPPNMMAILKTGVLIPAAGDLITTVPAAVIAVQIRKRIRLRG